MFHIVDDEKEIRDFLVEALGLMGYEAEAFACPAEYVDYAGSTHYQTPYAILTDVQMPGMSGYEMLDRVRQLHPEVRTAVISGFPKYEGEAKARSCTFLTKPIEIDRFEHMVKSFANCYENGPNAEKYGCGNHEQHEAFDVEEWYCPHGKRCTGC